MLVFASFLSISVWATSGSDSVAETVTEPTPFAIEDYPEAYCLAQNIYFESRGSSFADKVSVTDVVLNRVKDSRYPNTICDVVYQARTDITGFPLRHQCQFSWFCDGKSDEPKEVDAWYEAQVIAYQMLYNKRFIGITEGATHYHSYKVDPYWADSFQFIGRNGDHIFYRWN